MPPSANPLKNRTNLLPL